MLIGQEVVKFNFLIREFSVPNGCFYFMSAFS